MIAIATIGWIAFGSAVILLLLSIVGLLSRIHNEQRVHNKTVEAQLELANTGKLPDNVQKLRQ